jgi:ribokinase
MVSPQGENCIVTAGACADGVDPVSAIAFAASARPGGWLLLQGNLPWSSTEAAAEEAARRGARVMLNAAPLRWPTNVPNRPWDVLVVNETEAEGIAGATGVSAAMRLHLGGARIAIVTLGAAGCAVAAEGHARVMAASPVRAIDSTGAGDTFCGVMIACLARGVGLDRAVRAAQRAAAITVTRPGAFMALPSSLELRPIMRDEGS